MQPNFGHRLRSGTATVWAIHWRAPVFKGLALAQSLRTSPTLKASGQSVSLYLRTLIILQTAWELCLVELFLDIFLRGLASTAWSFPWFIKVRIFGFPTSKAHRKLVFGVHCALCNLSLNPKCDLCKKVWSLDSPTPRLWLGSLSEKIVGNSENNVGILQSLWCQEILFLGYS